MDTWFYLHLINTFYFVLFMFCVPPVVAALLCWQEIKEYLNTRKGAQNEKQG
ncbi:hypothetical protein BpJC7_18000 [Weizmannia acidilactici]|uniref:Uncharacterized protein n=1 Tax=Weizmannia acidilactici TaxID=2607726 RepID=A0A5J4JJG6_9BACI|nr:hypothetical protein BpJC4_18690 [Weizmannia acidilactici]GER70497.1 hypothetical protein BpJC7_18000 [Weizmannia acidilactici]GER72602.1 hypothetical protein BpPP18_06690 [Weizmannia acidilactici]